MFNSWQ
jgi:hypothetical protein